MLKQPRTQRTRTDIVRDILAICKEPKRKTRIVYNCNLNFRILETYLADLIGKGLITLYENNKYVFHTTKKGLSWLKAFQEVQTIEGIIK